jgi:hypothetical protein
MRNRVLVVGLDPHRVPGPWDPEPVATAVAAGMAELADAGFAAVGCWVGLDGSDDVEAVVTAALAREPWDCVLLGGGLRGGDVVLFEALVNLTRKHAPRAAIAFNARPDGLLAAVRRQLSG